MCIGGIINAFYTRTHCSGSQNVGGLALASQALGCGGVDGRTVIGNGRHCCREASRAKAGQPPTGLTPVSPNGGRSGAVRQRACD